MTFQPFSSRRGLLWSLQSMGMGEIHGNGESLMNGGSLPNANVATRGRDDPVGAFSRSRSWDPRGCHRCNLMVSSCLTGSKWTLDPLMFSVLQHMTRPEVEDIRDSKFGYLFLLFAGLQTRLSKQRWMRVVVFCGAESGHWPIDEKPRGPYVEGKDSSYYKSHKNGCCACDEVDYSRVGKWTMPAPEGANGRVLTSEFFH